MNFNYLLDACIYAMAVDHRLNAVDYCKKTSRQNYV
jgi:hypothetical protein